jgi:Cdc6-like AAA superfamily ATPase
MKYNPFNPNSVVAPNLFAGRTSQVVDICKKLSLVQHNMPASFFVYGERGIGKTALVKLIKSVAEKENKIFKDVRMLTSYYLVENGQDIGSVLQESVNRLTAQMSTGVIKRLGSKLGDLFKNGKFTIGAYGLSAGVEAGEVEKRNITIKDQSVAVLSSIIESINEDKGAEDGVDDKAEPIDKEDGVLIIIDEVHNLKDKENVASILRNIVTTLDVEGLGSISFLLVGYKEDMEIFFAGDPSAHRTFDAIPLGTMPDNEASDVLKKGFEKAEVGFEDKALNENISVAGGYPRSLQMLGHKLLETDNDSNVGDKDWKDAIFNASMELRTKEFSRMYSFDKKRTAKDKILDFLAVKNEPMFKKEIQSEFEKCNAYQYIKSLKKSGAIRENSDGKIYLQSQLFRTAILVDIFIREGERKKVRENSSNIKEEENKKRPS